MRIPTQTTRYVLIAVAVGAIGAGTAEGTAKYISGKSIAKRSLPANRLTKNSVGSAELSKGVRTLLAKSGTPGPAGRNGVDGAAGAKGDTGAAGVDGKNAQTTLNENLTPTPAATPTPTPTPTPSPTPPPLGGDPVVVTDANLQGWTLAPKGDNGDTTPNGTVEFATPPSPSSLGDQALELNTTNGKPVVAYLPLPAGAAGTLHLSELRSASFSEYVKTQEVSGTGVSLQFEVTGSTSTHFSNGYTTVVFDPDLPSNATGSWKRHSLLSGGGLVGKVYSSQAASSANPNDCTISAPCDFTTWVSENPDAVVATIKLRTGQNNGVNFHGLDAFVDDVSVAFDGTANTRFDLGG